MNIIEIKKLLAAIRNYCKSNIIIVVGDGDGIKVDARKVEFAATTLPSNFTLNLGVINLDFVTRARSVGVIGFTSDNKTVYLNDCVTYKEMYNSNHNSDLRAGIPLMDIPGSENCKFILICEYDRFENNEVAYTYTLYISPDIKAAIAFEEEADKARWNSAYQSTKNYHLPGKNNRGGGGK